METYSVENIQNEDKWVVKDSSNKIIASFHKSSVCDAAKEADKYAYMLNERIWKDRYRALSDTISSVCDRAVTIQDFAKTLYDNMVDTENRPSTLTVGETLGFIRKELDSLNQAVAALPSVNEFSAVKKLIAEKGLP